MSLGERRIIPCQELLNNGDTKLHNGIKDKETNVETPRVGEVMQSLEYQAKEFSSLMNNQKL